MKFKSHIPIQIDIDGEEELRLGVKRLNYEEASEFRAKLKEAQNAAEDKSSELWGQLLRDCLRRFVRLECKLTVECADGEIEIRKAEDLLDYFGGFPGVLGQIIYSTMAQHSLTELQKKVLKLRTDCSSSSAAQEKDPPGQRPETTAAGAGNGDFVANEDAPGPVQSQSGSTEEETPSSSTSARSCH